VFEYERGHGFGVKRTHKEKKDWLASGLNVDKDINL
jgi:hypothetical protein